MCSLHSLKPEHASHIQTYTYLVLLCYRLPIIIVSGHKIESRWASAFYTVFLESLQVSYSPICREHVPKRCSYQFSQFVEIFFLFFMSCWYCHPSLLLRISNSITLWWFSFKLSSTIRILAISFLLISTKSKWASHSNFLHLKKLNYPQHLLHITQTPFSKLNFLIGFSTAFLTNVNEHNFCVSFRIAIAWFSRVLALCRTVLLKTNFSWFQAWLWLFAFLKRSSLRISRPS